MRNEPQPQPVTEAQDGGLLAGADAVGPIAAEPAVRKRALHAEAGAPTAGPPPWDVYVVVPETVFGLPADGDFTATRWSF